MRSSTAHKALCAVLALALVALPALTTAARVVPGTTVDQQVHQRALKTYDNVIGYLPCYATPTGVVVDINVQVAIGALIGYIPICRGPSGIYLGAFISIKANLQLGGSVALPGTLPLALGVAAAVDIGVVIGKFIPCSYGAPSSSLLAVGLGIGLDVNLNVAIGGLKAIAAVEIDAAVGLGVGAAVGGVLTVSKTSIDLLGLIKLGSTLGCLPYITAPATSSPCGHLDNICLGPVAGAHPASTPKSIVPSTLVVAGISAKVVIGYFPLFLHAHTGTTAVLGLVDLALGVSVEAGILVGATKCSVSGAPFAYIAVYGSA